MMKTKGKMYNYLPPNEGRKKMSGKISLQTLLFAQSSVGLAPNVHTPRVW
jgi:hypothetical protein